jgi:hypothetical protein
MDYVIAARSGLLEKFSKRGGIYDQGSSELNCGLRPHGPNYVFCLNDYCRPPRLWSASSLQARALTCAVNEFFHWANLR